MQNYPLVGKVKAAKHLNRSIDSIRQKAWRLKLKQDRKSEFFRDWQSRAAKSKVGKKRPEQAQVMLKLHKQGKLKMTPERKLKISIQTKERFRNGAHPKGFLSKKHTVLSREKISKASQKMWADPSSMCNVNLEVNRQTSSDRMIQMQRDGKLRQGYSRGKQGRREDLGIYVRSSWEANFCRYLNFLKSKEMIYKWEYEPDTFWFHEIKRGTRSYLPDFKIWDKQDSTPYYIEVKGWMDAKSKTKLDRMAKYYPHVRVDIVGRKEYEEIRSKLSRVIPGWE